MSRRIDAVMQVRRRAAGITGVADIADDIAGGDEISGLEIAESVQMRIVMHLAPGTEDPNHTAAEPVFTDSKYQTARRGSYGCPLGGENIDALVRSSVAARSAPGVAQRGRGNTGDGQRQSFGLLFQSQAQRDDRPFEWTRPEQQTGERDKK